MAIYKTAELFDEILHLLNNGFDYVEITEEEADSDFPASLGFDGIISCNSSEGFSEIDSVEVPVHYSHGSFSLDIQPDDVAKRISFSFNELCSIINAVDNALEYGKERLSATDCSKEERRDIKALAVDFRNLQAKLVGFQLNKYFETKFFICKVVHFTGHLS